MHQQTTRSLGKRNAGVASPSGHSSSLSEVTHRQAAQLFWSRSDRGRNRRDSMACSGTGAHTSLCRDKKAAIWHSKFNAGIATFSARRLLNSEAARPLNAGVLLRRHGRHLTLNASTAAKRLVADLERLKAGTIAASTLIASPVLDQWTHSFRKVACLEGVVEGHP